MVNSLPGFFDFLLKVCTRFCQLFGRFAKAMIAKSLRVKNSNFLQQICKCIGSVQIPSEKHLLHINRYYIQRKEDDLIVGASVKSATVSTVCSPCSPTAQKIMSLISRNNRVISCLVLLLLVHTVFDSRKDGNRVRRVRGTTAVQTAGYVLPPQKLRIIAETKLEDSKVEVKVLSTDSIYQRESWDGSPVVLESHKLVFFTTAKVGCTTFKMLFRRMMGFENYAEESRDGPTGRMLPWNPEKNGLKYLYDYDLDRATDMMTSPDWTRAIFVRELKVEMHTLYQTQSLCGSPCVRPWFTFIASSSSGAKRSEACPRSSRQRVGPDDYVNRTE